MVRGYRLSIVSWEGSIRARGMDATRPRGTVVARDCARGISNNRSGREGVGVGVDGDSLERIAAHDAIALELGVNVEAPDVGHGVPCGSAPRVCARRREWRRIQTGLSIFIWDASIQTSDFLNPGFSSRAHPGVHDISV